MITISESKWESQGKGWEGMFSFNPPFFFTSYIGMECGFSHSKEKGKKLALALWGLTNTVITHRYVYLFGIFKKCS